MYVARGMMGNTPFNIPIYMRVRCARGLTWLTLLIQVARRVRCLKLDGGVAYAT